MYKNFFKPLFDCFIAMVILILSFPLTLTAGLCLLIMNNGKVFFTQTRPGKDEALFKVIKFKTMNDKKNINGDLLPDAERLTKVGAFIRKTSLDEIPQLLNVLKGDMSLIGPRPLLPEYLPLYNDEQRMRHLVKPGITGWAQVNGRNAISWEKKFELDVWYVRNCSLLLDSKVFFMTIRNILASKDISQDGHATVEWFKGNRL
jgi:undecaprenyl phosphate N,N'-diacetylbacillosamine 1-phosphate transferase